MNKAAGKKKTHHFVHDGYLSAWRTENRIFAFNLHTNKPFEATGRNTVGAIGKFNYFSFDETVVALLNYTFQHRALHKESAGIYELMLAFTNFMKYFDYQHKADNFLEDFYEKMETRIGFALRKVSRDGLHIASWNPEVFDNLVLFYCLQFMRTPKKRRAFSNSMVEIGYGDVKLNAQQRDEYIKMHLLISSLAMAMDILRMGCVIRLHYARFGEKFLNSDDPVMTTSGQVKRFEDYTGKIPLNPCLLMELDSIGLGMKRRDYSEIANAAVEDMNSKMILNADRALYFNSHNHRTKYLNLISTLR